MPSIRKRRKRIRYKNEHLTGVYLEKLLGFVPKRQLYIRKPIIVNNETIKKYIICDFYFKLPNDVQCIVEYNGIQHYAAKKYKTRWQQKRADENFRKQVIRDKWLETYCYDNNIVLISIDGRKYTGLKILAYLKDLVTYL